MSTGSDSSVIKKKALSGREDFDARAMSWSKAVRLSLERVSDRLFGLQLAVRTVEQTAITLAELRDVASGDRLIMLLDAYGDFAGDEAQNGVPGRGAAVLDRGLVQTLVEVQTRGNVTQAELETRAFTYTDAAVTAQLIDPVLSSVDEMMSDTPQSSDPLRLRYGDKVDDGRALLLALEAPDYILFRISLDIENGLRSGDMVLAVPEEMLRPPAPAPDPDENETGTFDLSGMALSAPISLNAVVARLTMPLSRVCTLKPGDTLPVSRNALAKTELVGSKGFILGKVALGQMNGFRAVRLGPNEAEDATVPLQMEQDLIPEPASPLPDPIPMEDPPILETGELELPDVSINDDLPDLSADLALDLGSEVPDAPDLSDLADLSGLDDATLTPSAEDLPDLPDLPAL